MCLTRFLRVVKCVKIINDVLRKIRDLIASKQEDQVGGSKMASPKTLYQLSLERVCSDVLPHSPFDPDVPLPCSIEMDLAIAVSTTLLKGIATHKNILVCHVVGCHEQLLQILSNYAQQVTNEFLKSSLV